MANPTKPYATSAQVAFLIPNLMNGNTDFDDIKTNPKKSAVDQYISWVSIQLDMQFQQAGYVLPLTSLDGEEWPEHQTMYLQLVSALGAAALTGGHVHKPAPAVSTGRGNSSGNIYQDMFNLELNKIWDKTNKTSDIRFRAKYYSSTPAEKSVMEPYGPSLDYLTGNMNPEDFLMLEDYTNLRLSITNYMSIAYSLNPLDWNDFHNLVSEKINAY
jgi:hypothetical protein